MESSTQIEHQAAAWLVRRDGDAWTEDDQAALDAWLAGSVARRVAFLRLEAVSEESLRLKALAAGLPPGAGRNTRWRLLPYGVPEGPVVGSAGKRFAVAVAAALVLALGCVVYFASGLFGGDRFSTPVGGTASVPLRDGSRVVMNTASSIRVELTDQERRIELTRGEAFFEVAKDPARPFVVHAGSQRVVAVGTKFSVRREGDSVKVVVTEGRVKVEDELEREPRQIADGAHESPGELLLSAGNVARAGGGDLLVQRKTAAETEEALAWRNGYLIFRDTPLSEAVAEFNRYSEQQAVVADAVVSGILLTGKFKSTNYEAFIRLLQEGYGIRAERTAGRILLTGGAFARY